MHILVIGQFSSKGAGGFTFQCTVSRISFVGAAKLNGRDPVKQAPPAELKKHAGAQP